MIKTIDKLEWLNNFIFKGRIKFINKEQIAHKNNDLILIFKPIKFANL